MPDFPVLDPVALLAQQGWIERLACGLVRDSSLAQDLAQEAWLVAREGAPAEVDARCGFLSGVVRNLRRNVARSERRRQARELAAARPEALPSAAELVERAELARCLVESVLTLDEHERTAVLLRYFEGLSAEEIARRSGVPAGTVRARLSRGLERLRARLEARMERRDLLAGLALLAKYGSPAPATSAAPALPWIGGLLAMKTLTLGGAAVLSLVCALFWWTRTPERGGVPPSERTSEVATSKEALLSPVERTPTIVENRRDALALEAPPAITGASAPRPRARLLADVRDEQGLGLDRVVVFLNDKLLGPGDVRGSVDLELPHDDAFEGLITLDFTREGHARVRRHVFLRATREVHLGKVTLRRGAALQGRVVDELGNAVAGASVLATGLEDERTDPEELRRLGPRGDENSVRVTSAPDGSFALEAVALGAGRVWAGHAGFSWSQARFELGPDGLFELELVLHPLDPRDVITGHIVDPDGRPVPRARIHTWFMAVDYGSGSELEADDDGRFELLLEQRVAHDLTVADPENRWSEVYRDAVEPGTRELEIRFEVARWMEVEVRAGERAFEPFTLVLDQSDPTRGRRMTLSTEPAGDGPYPGGRVRVRMPTVPFTLEAKALGYASDRAGPLAPETAPEHVTLELDALPGLRGIVRTPAGAPVAGAKVGLHRLPGERVEIRDGSFRLNVQTWTEFRTTSDAEGRFVLYPPPPGDGLYQGRESLVRVTAEGYAPTELPPAVYEPREGYEVEIELVRGGAIEGVARHSSALDPSGFLLAFQRGDGDTKTVRLGPDGRYRLEGLTPGPWWIQLLDEELTGVRSGSSSILHDEAAPPYEPWTCTVADGATTRYDVDLDANAPGRVRGTLELDGRTVTGWTASLIQELAIAEDLAESTALDASGGFVLGAPRPGEYTLVLSGPEEPCGRLVIRESLSIEPGEQSWSLALAPGRVEGSGALATGSSERFFRYEWRPELPGRRLSAQFRLLPDAAGRFFLSTVPPGRGRIASNTPVAGTGDFAPWDELARFELAPGATVRVALP